MEIETDEISFKAKSKHEMYSLLSEKMGYIFLLKVTPITSIFNNYAKLAKRK